MSIKVKQLDEDFLPWLSGVMQIVHEHGSNPLARSAASVNCDGCDLCCCNSNTLVTNEEALNPILKALPLHDEQLVIPKNHLKRCIHLTETGCAIFDDRPSTCRVFDCRKRIVANMADPFTLEMAEQWDMTSWYTEENRLIISAIRNAALSYHEAKPSANISEITFYAIMNWGEFMGLVWQAMKEQPTNIECALYKCEWRNDSDPGYVVYRDDGSINRVACFVEEPNAEEYCRHRNFWVEIVGSDDVRSIHEK